MLAKTRVPLRELFKCENRRKAFFNFGDNFILVKITYRIQIEGSLFFVEFLSQFLSLEEIITKSIKIIKIFRWKIMEEFINIFKSSFLLFLFFVFFFLSILNHSQINRETVTPYEKISVVVDYLLSRIKLYQLFKHYHAIMCIHQFASINTTTLQI